MGQHPQASSHDQKEISSVGAPATHCVRCQDKGGTLAHRDLFVFLEPFSLGPCVIRRVSLVMCAWVVHTRRVALCDIMTCSLGPLIVIHLLLWLAPLLDTCDSHIFSWGHNSLTTKSLLRSWKILHLMCHLKDLHLT